MMIKMNSKNGTSVFYKLEKVVIRKNGFLETEWNELLKGVGLLEGY